MKIEQSNGHTQKTADKVSPSTKRRRRQEKNVIGIRPITIFHEYGRNRITNGNRIINDKHTRRIWTMRVRDLIALHLNDMGGADRASAAQLAIIRRAAVLECECERFELMFAIDDGPHDHKLDVYQRVSNTLRRLLEAIGLERRPRDVTPTLDQYLARPNNGVEAADG
jgi:hypothetical protein